MGFSKSYRINSYFSVWNLIPDKAGGRNLSGLNHYEEFIRLHSGDSDGGICSDPPDILRSQSP